ncbi:MurR/RpiR family transcriptional regulator [Pseudooceanicola sp. C21-150M6]|uniref:MurR/RpiR family transcriptional regulator n=1 Tax=Pseudooceanicola sp. C21-150M6 TaxID=3434355 RepID=UPI003D7FA86F
MLQRDALRDRIVARYEDMSPQLQQAARYILEHTQEVALVSMRELARNAGVQPATMTRLAKFLDLPGFDDIRSHFSDALRLRAEGFAARARESDGRNEAAGSGLAHDMLQSLSAQIARLSDPEAVAKLEATAELLGGARRIYVLGLRSCHSVAWHFHYVMTLLGDRTVHLDGPAGTGADGLLRAGAGDVLLVISISPYAQQSLELAALAREKGMAVVAITDSEVSPLVPISDQAILHSTESRTFFHTLTPALALSEVLCGLLAAQDREASLKALQAADQHLGRLNIYANSIPRRRI